MARVLQWAAALSAALAGFPVAAATYSQPDAERTIRESEAAWVAAEVAGDPSVALRILADDYVGVFPDGSIGAKSDAVAFFKPGNASLSGHLDYVHIRFFGDTAVAQGQETDVRPVGGPVPSGRLIFTDVFVLRDGRWWLVNSEDQFEPLPK
jgi:ketosteroid isomerase-like protein